jgi:hypothetical protein
MLISDRIPITIGVIGHLDVMTTEANNLQIEKFFKDLAAAYPNSPIHLFSSIAEGADRYVAKIFLNLKRENEEYHERFELIVPMPFNPEEYKEDFDDTSDKEFDDLLRQAKRSFIVSCDGTEIDRPHQYLKTGKLIADSSLILIALWDGKPGKKGGTADIVKHKITGDDDTVAESTFEYDGTVFILPSERKHSSSHIEENYDGKEYLSVELVQKDATLKVALDKIDTINRDSLSIDKADLEKSQSYLFDTPEKLDLPLRSLLTWYSILDQLSLKSRRRELQVTAWLFVLGLFFILFLEIYSNIWVNKIILAVTMLILVLATVITIYSRVKKDHEKYLYNRTLAEALRIQLYWNFAGIQENVSDYILRIHRKEFTWVKHILSALYGLSHNNISIDPESINTLAQNWIKNQAGFFDTAIERMTSRIKNYNRLSNVSFVLAFTIFVSIFILGNLFEPDNFLLNILLVIAPILLGIFASIRAYINLKGYEQLLNQYELMQVIYKRAEAKIIELNQSQMKPDERKSYFRELFFVIGKEALIENGIWYLIFKEKEPEIEVT